MVLGPLVWDLGPGSQKLGDWRREIGDRTSLTENRTLKNRKTEHLYL